MEEICKFLKEAGHYFVATVDGSVPKVRPFATVNIFDGKLYIQSGKKKDVARQIAANPRVEISAVKGAEWVRLSGELVEDDRREARVKMLEAYPELQAMYDVDDGNMVVWYFKSAAATFCSLAAEPRSVAF